MIFSYYHSLTLHAQKDAKFRIFGFCYKGGSAPTPSILEKSGQIKEAYGVEKDGVHYVCVVLFRICQRRVCAFGILPYVLGLIPAEVKPEWISGSEHHVSVYRVKVEISDPVLEMLKRPSDVKWRWHSAENTPQLRDDIEGNFDEATGRQLRPVQTAPRFSWLFVYKRETWMTSAELSKVFSGLEDYNNARVGERWALLVRLKVAASAWQVYAMAKGFLPLEIFMEAPDARHFDHSLKLEEIAFQTTSERRIQAYVTRKNRSVIPLLSVR